MFLVRNGGEVTLRRAERPYLAVLYSGRVVAVKQQKLQPYTEASPKHSKSKKTTNRQNNTKLVNSIKYKK
jgi:hypothetical protein